MYNWRRAVRTSAVLALVLFNSHDCSQTTDWTPWEDPGKRSGRGVTSSCEQLYEEAYGGGWPDLKKQVEYRDRCS
jgi:hypothetical protein